MPFLLVSQVKETVHTDLEGHQFWPARISEVSATMFPTFGFVCRLVVRIAEGRAMAKSKFWSNPCVAAILSGSG